jgi:predicted GH43/DUF377 family glycosyl hydrolase
MMKGIRVVFFICLMAGCGEAATTIAPKGVDSGQSGADTGWAMLPFVKVDSVNPVLVPGAASFFDPLRREIVKWEEKDVFNPAIVVRNGKLYMLYRAQDKVGKPEGTSRIGLAVSDDGYHFTRRQQPVLYPAADAEKALEWEGGCEDPRVVQDDRGVYYMTYTGYDGQTARLLVATSFDLVHWFKHGSAFADAYTGKYSRSWSKSGSIVSRYLGSKIVATRINGKYWMYWGDQNIWAATSDDLIHWTPVEMAAGEKPPVKLKGQAVNLPGLKVVVGTRDGYWDSDLVESGPPAMLTKSGILLIYNGKNLRSIGDKAIAEGAYGGGQVLLDAHDPTRVLRRLQHDFIHPDKPYEITGQVNQVCFLEGLANFKGKWLLYYGTADSKIAVATGPEKAMGW